MHGIIFDKFRGFTEKFPGNGTWEKVVERANLGTPVCGINSTAPDSEFSSLFDAAVVLSGKPPAIVLNQFGEYLAPELLEMGSLFGLVHPNWKTLDLIENTQKMIHSVLHARNPQVNPPEIECKRINEIEVSITYKSSRKLCGLLKGIARGIAHFYGQEIDISESMCMGRGDPICHMNIFYKTTRETITGQNIFKDIESILQHGGDIKLNNLFKGVPVSHTATIIKKVEDIVLVKASSYQLAAIQSEEKTYITSPFTTMGIIAQLKWINWEDNTVELQDFSYTEDPFGKRREVRVVPDDILQVTIRLKDRNVNGEVLNISARGLALCVTDILDRKGEI